MGQPTLAEIEASVGDIEKIVSEGQERDGVTKTLAKGLVDGFNGLLELVKAKTPREVPSQPDSEEESDEEEQEQDGKDEEPEEKEDPLETPGYSDLDMEKGVLVDATEFFHEVRGGLAAIMTEMKDMEKGFSALREETHALRAENDRLSLALVEALAPMAKSMVSNHQDLSDLTKAVNVMDQRLLDIPAVPVGGLGMSRAAARNGIGDSRRVDERRLMKALSQRLISDAEATRYNRVGSFIDDPTTNKTLTDRIMAL